MILIRLTPFFLHFNLLIWIIAIIISIFMFAGCSPSEKNVDDDKARVKNTILLYNSMLIKGYAEQNMTPLREAATVKKVMKAYYHMSALGESQIKMIAHLKKIEFPYIKIESPEKAEAETNEKWDYEYINIKSKEKEYDNSIDYVNRYRLIREAGRWLVDKIDVLSSSEKKQERYRPITGSKNRADN